MTYKIDLEITFRPTVEFNNYNDVLKLNLTYEYIDDLDELPELIRKRMKERFNIGDL